MRVVTNLIYKAFTERFSSKTAVNLYSCSNNTTQLDEKMVNLRLYAWVLKGSQRIAIVKALTRPMTSMQILRKVRESHKRINIYNTCDILRTFLNQGLVICPNQEFRTGKLYQLSNEGEEIRRELIKS